MSEIKKTEKKVPQSGKTDKKVPESGKTDKKVPPVKKAPSDKKERIPVKRGRWLTCLLYPDNCHQMEVLDYLKKIGLTMLYITHEPEDDEKKEHMHVMMHFDYPRTASGFCSAFGVGRFVKSGDLYKPVADNVDCTGLSVVQLPILSHAEVVNSPADYFRYFLHQDFKSIKAGKKRYEISDMTFCGNENELHKLAYQEWQQYNTLIYELMDYADCAKNSHDLIQTLMDNNRYDLISYIQGHAYFIKEFFLRSEVKPKPKTTILDTIKGGE